MTNRILYRAAWVAAMTETMPLIADGAVLVVNGRILAVGRFQDLRGEIAVVHESDGVITPALINAHAHLELSHLAGPADEQPEGRLGSFPDWIRGLLRRREKAGTGVMIQESAQKALAGLVSEGCAAVADIGNLPESRFLAENSAAMVLFFQEFYGLSLAGQEKALSNLNQLPDEFAATGHSLYSTGEKLLVRLKQRATGAGRIFPLHVAESIDEIEFLKTGQGPFRDFVQERGVWDSSFVAPCLGAVGYLDSLKLLDQQTVCVHAVHVTEDEIRLLGERQAKVCLCPGSNRTLGVGKPPVAAFIKHAIPLALGTDSLASNPKLSLWREMRLLQEDHPGLTPEIIFAMATRGGAEVLGIAAEWGTLASGRAAAMLAIACPRLSTAAGVFEFLVQEGETAQIRWLN